jgi:hypothetical protein
MNEQTSQDGMQTEIPEQKMSMPKKKPKVKYKVDYKKLSFLIGGAILIGGLIWGGIYFFRSKNKTEYKVYDAAIQLRDQKNSNPEEDARSSSKKGDVILIRETGREWSDTEKVSYLIIKIKLSDEQAQKIVQAKATNLSKEEALEKGILNEEMSKDMQKEELDQLLKEDILFREYRIDIDKLGLDLEKIQKERKIPEEEFNWKIVEKK